MRRASERYRVLEEIARGGMGRIVRVWDEDLQRVSAMKIVLDEASRGGSEGKDAASSLLLRFTEEAQVTGQLDHPNIVPVHDLGRLVDGRSYFTMRLVQGEDLSAVFRQVQQGSRDWTRERVLGALLKVCEAMSYAHAKGVVHRDLKPANVMVGKFGELYVMDWGLARVLGRTDLRDIRLQAPAAATTRIRSDRAGQRADDPGSPLLTMDGDVVGTPSYMAPEQARGDIEAIGPHSDVYSIGAMLYELLAGAPPYVPKDGRASPHTILAAVLHGPPPELPRAAAPIELAAIVAKAMRRDIADRYPSTKELADDLRSYLEGRVVQAHATGSWRRLWKWARRNRALTAALAVSILLALGLTIAGVQWWVQNRLAEAAQHSALGSLDASTFDAWLEDVEGSGVPAPSPGHYRFADLAGANNLVSQVDTITLVDYRGPRTDLAVWHEVFESGQITSKSLLFQVPFGQRVIWTQEEGYHSHEVGPPLTEGLQALLLSVDEPHDGSKTHRVELRLLGSSWHLATRYGSTRLPPRPSRGEFEFQRPGGGYMGGRSIPNMIAPQQLLENHRSQDEPLLLWHQTFNSRDWEARIESRIVAEFVEH